MAIDMKTPENVAVELGQYFDWDPGSEQVNEILKTLREAEARGRDEQRRQDVLLINNEALEPGLAEWLERQELSAKESPR